MEERLSELQKEYANLCAMLGQAVYTYHEHHRQLIDKIDDLQRQHKAVSDAVLKSTEPLNMKEQSAEGK